MINFNKDILKPNIQEFINQNINSDVSQLALKGIPFPDNLKKDIITQIEAKQKCNKKLPTWYNSTNIYFPTKLNIEQTSSEATAKYKSELISGELLIDLTGGFGVDSLYFSKQVKKVVHCDINAVLSDIVRYNSKTLKLNNIDFYNQDGLEVLKQINQKFDWVYVDPSRRDDDKGKVFLLKDCLPNIPDNLNLLFKYTNNVMIKTSPLLDISLGITQLQNVKTIHCVALNNEVKEILWILEKDFIGEIEIQTVNLDKNDKQKFNFILNNEAEQIPDYSLPLNYLYEPNVAILKSGAFNTIGSQLNLNKLHKHSHLYTSKDLTTFPGRKFKIEQIIPYNKKEFNKQLGLKQANITIRNFPESVSQIRKKLKIKDGGKNYLFFTTNLDNSKIIILCSKI